MLRLRTLILAAALAAPPALYIRSKLLSLIEAYPPLPVEQASTPGLRSPRAPGARRADTDVFSARVPVNALRHTADGPSQLSLEELWAKAFLQCKIFKFEATLVGFGSPGDMGEQGFGPGHDVLGAGLMHVLRPPAKGAPLLIEWSMPLRARRFFDKLAAWGSPWKLMEGGRQEWSIGSVSRLPGETEDMVEIRYACGQDYKIVVGENGEGKMVPDWFGRIHRVYARILLDETAREIRGRVAAR